ncbi:hypothetical protein G8V06_09315 [Clostridium botulinum D/C]|uniref:hypothetical protein n=1 Tax=Clostridium botulinum TaxID=1491 RepID=UPI001E3991D9|nr:hypothetical protein [Clostridium botulinum]MCD3234289.1 hypothetical protein [Clostridium botulinum D/C]MCD3240273.1 hypothetical protein [Clostridium botulinum D/C]MCD3267708.1 hypothetical protein [Clostridium botulinum D/C]MCD3306105.1 hypothetical protein [Clostridium botulinum D/C]MCD3314889.1 hypothetical protein [Clostridium botulinum D/C]
MEKYKRGQLIKVNNIDAVVVRASGKEGYVVARHLNGDSLMLLEGELGKRLDAENLTKIILSKVNNILPLEDYLEDEDIKEIKENIEEWLNEIR